MTITLKTLAILCSPLLLCAGVASAEDAGQKNADVVVGSVNGEAIHLAQLKAFYEAAKANFGNVSFEQGYEAVRDELLAQKALLADAKKNGLDRDPAIKKEIEEATALVLWRGNLQQRVRPLVNDEAIAKQYVEFAKSYEGKKEVHARHILVASEQDANDLIKKLQSGADFAAVAKESSTDKGSGANGGDLGFFGEAMMVPEFSTAVFALKAGEITKKPVHSQFGWHIIKAEEFRKAVAPSLDSVKQKIYGELFAKKGKEVIAGIEAGQEIKKFNLDGTPETKK